MRIAYFTSCYPRATDSFIRNEVKELRKIGFQVFTFSVRKPDSSQLVSEEISFEFSQTQYLLNNFFLLFFSMAFYFIRHPIRFIKTAFLALKTRAPGFKRLFLQCAYFIEACGLAKFLENKNVQHLHNHMGESSATVAMLASQLSKIPFSQTIHGSGIFYHPEKWALGEKISRSAFTRCISDFCKSQCMVFSPYQDWHKLHVVHCIIDEIYFSEPLSRPAEEPRLVIIGRLDPIKGHLLLLEAAAYLFQKNIRFKLCVIGDGPLRPAIQKNIDENKLEKHVELLGWRGNEEVKQQILRSQAVICSSFNEGLPVVLIESLALRRPVVAPWISGIPELVKNGVNGFLFPPGSLKGLALAIEKLLESDQKTLHEMGERGSQQIKTEFNTQVEINKLASLIRNSKIP